MTTLVALLVLAAAYALLRRCAHAGAAAGFGAVCWAAIPLDVAPILLGWLALLSLTARPLLCAIAIGTAGAALAVGDVAKRRTLREPLVFADRAEFIEVARHPALYIPFAGPILCAAILGGAALLIALLAWLEPAAPRPSPLLVLPLVLACAALPAWPPLTRPIARLYARLAPTRDPAQDMRRFGFLAALVIHATIAKAERPARQGAIEAAIPVPATSIPTPPGPVILVQAESFFDATRLGPRIPPSVLPEFTGFRAAATQSGQLTVPCWGANTVRTEFMALTGIGPAALGLDVFNPYEKFAAIRLPSIAWQMKRAGYRTICLHAFDKSFYARDRVLPLLGFDEFRGPEAFPEAERVGRYVSDEAIAAAILRTLAETGPRTFIFAITMGNHGPWDAAMRHPPLPHPPDLDGIPEADPLRRFLTALAGTDRMLALLRDGLPPESTLALYGDHQPSLPAAFAALAFDDPRTDYAVFAPFHPPRPHADLAAQDLAALLLSLLARPATPARGPVPVPLPAMDSARPHLP